MTEHTPVTTATTKPTNNTADIVKKVWSFCNMLRDDGVSYSDYLEQITYPLSALVFHICKEEVTLVAASYHWC